MQEEELQNQNPNKPEIDERNDKPNIKEEQKVSLEPQQQREPKDIGTAVSKIKEDNEALFQAAYGERKSMNITRIRQYMKKRTASFQQRAKICDLLRIKFQEKQKNTRAFLKSVIKFYEDYVQLYISLQKSLTKFELKRKYPTQITYAGLRDAIQELIQLNQDESEHVQKFIDWIQKILIQALKSAESYFKDRMKKLNKELEKTDSEYKNIWEKEEKAYEKISQGNDLLEKQLTLMERIKVTNESAVTRIVGIYQAWEFLLAEERTIKKILSQNILQFHDRLTKFHKRTQKKTDGAQGIFKYWSKLPETPNALTIFATLLDPKDIEYMSFGCREKRLDMIFEQFMRMVHEEERIGNPFIYMDILVAKKFKSKVQRSQREWRQVKLIFSVDHNLLLFDEKQGKILLKLKQTSIKVLRSSENILELNGVQEGFIFDSNKKQSIHFQTLDEVQEFVFFISTIPEQKNN